ncbi:GntR family transcriptional regulator [Streptococcus himalayensis]|uniref:GntR family transcriptional regulator n=1 Tax=Streptococcus himalayensis TaxID=1888195 RepID=A0A917EED9_9STRE|nr:GntR family transcriptional regulator [Streptococcus himalayensis]GGE23724.1 GntR family transcriptional regulator [Streptococcus himalayensis]
MVVPKYQYIKDELKNKIISGQFENGDKFYTEAELINLYNVSSITVVRALNELAKDGYIIRQQGKGTFVSRARKHKLVEFSDVELFGSQDDDQVIVLSIERENDDRILEKLGLKNTQFYYKIERIRKAKGVVYLYDKSYIPEQYINANYPDLSYYSSIYKRFKEDYHIHLNDEHFEESNVILFPTPEDICQVLEIDSTFPVVYQEKTTQLETTGQVIEYDETYKRADFFKIKFVSRNRPN